MNKSSLKWLFLSASLLVTVTFRAETINVIESNFRNIPDKQQLAVYWYWLAGNMSKEGVVKDLQAMKRVGINRVQIGMIGEGQGAPEGPVKAFSDEWWDILHQAMKTAGDLDIEVGVFNCPGWSQSGGPWVKPNQAMRYLAYHNDTIAGGSVVSLDLSLKNKEAQLVKVLAYPVISSKAKFSVLEDVRNAKEIHLLGENSVIVRSLTIVPAHKKGKTKAALYVKDGVGYKLIRNFTIDRSNPELHVGFMPYAPVAASLPETEGKAFKLVLDKPGMIQDIKLSDIPVVESYAEKTLAKMWQTPHPMWDAYMWRNQPEYSSAFAVAPEQVVDLTDELDAKDHLHWNAPKGRWVVMQTYMLPTGTTNAPAPSEITGYETDKMSKKHIEAHFDNYIGKILQKIPAEDRKTFKIVVEDSYETGGQNWTDDMIPDFKDSYGYDPVPFLPVFSGVVIGSEDKSDRFLWDIRRLIADEVSYNYVGGLREVSNKHGMTTWLENYGHWGFPGEFLQYGSQSDEIAGEFWSFGTLGDIENRIASSCGHIYGKKKIWAESFTCGGPDFTQYPGQMKQRGDRFFAEGINATLLHLYIQQPNDDVPGINAWFGNEFNRNNTWFSHMDVFGKYLKRCNYILQQGRYVADVAYFIGEDAPKMTGIRTPEIPKGYSYDYVNADVLLKARVNDGCLCLESGMEYSVLVLPIQKTMRPEVLAKLREMVKDGLTIIGPAPESSPSLKDYPKADIQVKEMAEEMWQTMTKPYADKLLYGKGRIYKNASLEQVFTELNVIPDFSTDDCLCPILFLHRTLDDAEVYFVSNQSDSSVSFNASFRVKNMQPELWNPLDASVRLLPEFSSKASCTQLPMVLEPFESAFVVFRKPAELHEGVNYPQKEVLLKVKTPWMVTFQEGRGGPTGPITFESLTDWTSNENVSIKYFSGTAVYKNRVKLTKLPVKHVYVDLGKVMVMAKLRINGKDAGGVWTPPYRLDVSSLLKKGYNDIEVEVVNCWHNRLIGEKSLPASERFTKQSVTYLKADTELQPSGLLGPVEIVSFDYK